MLFSEEDKRELYILRIQEQQNEIEKLREDNAYKNYRISELKDEIKEMKYKIQMISQLEDELKKMKHELEIFKSYQTKIIQLSTKLNDEL